jgi:hypothetical protein
MTAFERERMIDLIPPQSTAEAGMVNWVNVVVKWVLADGLCARSRNLERRTRPGTTTNERGCRGPRERLFLTIVAFQQAMPYTLSLSCVSRCIISLVLANQEMLLPV